jgi:hypothetical protein
VSKVVFVTPRIRIRDNEARLWCYGFTGFTVMGWTAPRRHQVCQDECCHQPI